MKVRIEVDCETWRHVQLNLRRENTSKSRHFGLLQQGGRKSETPTSEQVVGVLGLDLVE